MDVGKWVWGLFFVLLGAAWIASNMGILPYDFGDWWPVIFIVIGISTLPGSILWGLFFIILGAVWIGTNLGIISGTILSWWPLIFVFIGISILFPKEEHGWQKMDNFGKGCEKMFKQKDWQEFGKDMEKFGKKMEQKYSPETKKKQKK